MEFDLRDRTILLTIFGSRSYGMHRPDSDVDLRGVCVPTRPYFDGYTLQFEQADKPVHMATYYDLLTAEEQHATDLEGKNDGAVYGIKKFFKLASDCNANILEALFCRDSEVRMCTPEGQMLRDRRHDFLSRKSLYTFACYAAGQMKRINTHRHWLLSPVTRMPTRADFGLKPVPEIPKNQLDAALSAIRRKVDGWSLDFTGMEDSQRIYILDQVQQAMAEIEITQDTKFGAAARALGYEENFIEMVDKERHFRSGMDNFHAYEKWKAERNVKRAEMEAVAGYDCKHASHCVRLLSACREILTEANYTVWRPDAAGLMDIRNGAWSYERLISFVEQEDAELKVLAQRSPLPLQPDYKKLDALCMDIVGRMT